MYASVMNKTSRQLEEELTDVYNNNTEYCGVMSFSAMVRMFAHSDFYEMHETAKAYLSISFGPITFYMK